MSIRQIPSRWANDKTVGKLALYAIGLYVVFYGLAISKGFQVGEFSVVYLSILLPIFLIDSVRTLFESFLQGEFYKGEENLAEVTVVIPTLNGGAKVERTLLDLLHRFPAKRILVCSNGSTDNTCELARKLKVGVLEIKDPIGKVAAINEGLALVKTKYCLIMDDDTLIHDAKIPTQALEDGYDGVAFRVFPMITNWLTKIQMYEYQKSMDIGKKFHNKWGTVQNISGAIGLFTTKELKRQIELHTGEFSGEDLQRTLLVHLNKNGKGVVVSDSIIYTEAPDTVMTLFNQRICGWYPGLLSNLGRYFKLMLNRNTPFSLKYDALYNSVLVVLADPVRILALPIIVFYPWYFVVMYFVYVGVEAIPYLKLGRKSPVWVLLVCPFYGLFGFITRICADAVFVYRRAVVYTLNQPKLDDYRRVNIPARWLGIGMSMIVFCTPLFGWFSVRTSAQNLTQAEFMDPRVMAQNTDHEISLRHSHLTKELSPRGNSYVYTLKVDRGMTWWFISKMAINQYALDRNLHLSDEELTYWAALLSRSLGKTPLHYGNEYTITEERILNVK